MNFTWKVFCVIACLNSSFASDCTQDFMVIEGGLYHLHGRLEDAMTKLYKFFGGDTLFPPQVSIEESSLSDSVSPGGVPKTPDDTGNEMPLDPVRFTNGHSVIDMVDAKGTNYLLEVLRDNDDGGMAIHVNGHKKYRVTWNADRIVSCDEHPHHPLGGCSVPLPRMQRRLTMASAVGGASVILARLPDGSVTETSGTIAAQLMEIRAISEEIQRSGLISWGKEIRAAESLNTTNIARLSNKIDTFEHYVRQSFEYQNERLCQILSLIVDLHNRCFPQSPVHKRFDPNLSMPVPQHWLPESQRHF
jgi:hypothetical protein